MTLFNASKAYVRQLEKGEKYKYLQPVYSLNLIDDTFDTDPSMFYHHYKIVNSENTGKQIKGLEFVFVELPKFKPQAIYQKKLQVLWLRYLTEINDNTTDIPSELLADPEVREAIECLQESAFTKSELEAYDKYWDQVRVERTIREDSHLKGKAEGEQTGVYKTALRILRKGNTITDTSEFTGLATKIVNELDLLLKKVWERG